MDASVPLSLRLIMASGKARVFCRLKPHEERVFRLVYYQVLFAMEVHNTVSVLAPGTLSRILVFVSWRLNVCSPAVNYVCDGSANTAKKDIQEYRHVTPVVCCEMKGLFHAISCIGHTKPFYAAIRTLRHDEILVS